MTSTTFRKGEGGTTEIPLETLRALGGQLRGSLCFPGDAGYEEARTLWNAMIDKRPAAVRPGGGAVDVVRGRATGGEARAAAAVRGGGHNIAGNAVCDGGLMIDLSRMRSVRVDPAARTARVEPGATLGDLDAKAQAFGLATPLGINSTTGDRGLTLGGGFGWLSRKPTA